MYHNSSTSNLAPHKALAWIAIPWLPLYLLQQLLLQAVCICASYQCRSEDSSSRMHSKKNHTKAEGPSSSSYTHQTYFGPNRLPSRICEWHHRASSNLANKLGLLSLTTSRMLGWNLMTGSQRLRTNVVLRKCEFLLREFFHPQNHLSL